MSKREKRLLKIRQNPHNVSMVELEQVLNDYDIIRDRAIGSHYIFRYNLNGQAMKIAIPYNKPIKEVYIKKSVAVIDQILSQAIEVKHDE